MSIGWHIDRILDESDSRNKKQPSRGIGLSDECVYDQISKGKNDKNKKRTQQATTRVSK